MTEEIKHLDASARSFEANGRKYIIYADLTEGLYEKLEEFKIEMSCGNTAGEMLALAQKAYNCLNSHKFADGAVHLYNLINGGESITEKRRRAWALVFTLFVRPEGVPIHEWSQELAEEWLNDFDKEGISAASLFHRATGLLTNFVLDWKPSSQDTSGGPSASENEQGRGQTVANR